jgi:MFS family permease
MVAGMVTGSTQIGARLMTRVPARYLMTPGLLVASAGMLMLTQIGPDSSYVGLILPAFLLIGLGMGTTFMPAMSLATYGVEPRDAGIASAMINTSQQIGGAIGVALLNTIAASATTTYIAANAATAASPELLQLEAMVEGFTSAIWWAVVILVGSAAIAFALVNAGSQSQAPEFGGGEELAGDGEAAPVIAH